MHDTFRIADALPSTQAPRPPVPFDPDLLHAARAIYQRYNSIHPDAMPRPLGVAIDRFTYRGQLVFKMFPVLLPQECFISIQQLEPHSSS